MRENQCTHKKKDFTLSDKVSDKREKVFRIVFYCFVEKKVGFQTRLQNCVSHISIFRNVVGWNVTIHVCPTFLLVAGTVRGKVSKRSGVVEGTGSVTEIVGSKVLV